MATAYAMSLDGHSFDRDEIFFKGPIEEIAPQVWSEQPVLGTADPGDILTFLGTRSQKWPMDGFFDEASKDKLVSIFTTRLPVTFITPQDGVGFLVLLRDLVAEHEVAAPTDPDGNARWHCSFTLTARAS